MNELVWIGWAVTLLIIIGIARLDIVYRRRMMDMIDGLEDRVDSSMGQMRESLSVYKLEVAKTYVVTGYLKDVETRLTHHLIRIEGRLK